MELAVAKDPPNNNIRIATYKDKPWFAVKDILTGYDLFSINTIINKIGKKRKTTLNGQIYVDQRGVQVLCHRITGEFNSDYETYILKTLMNKLHVAKPKVTIDKNIDPEIMALKRNVADLQKKVEYLMSLLTGAPEPNNIKKNHSTSIDKLLAEPHMEPSKAFWSSWCCSMINKLYFRALDRGQYIDRASFFIMIYKQLEDKFHINLKEIRRRTGKKSQIKVVETNDEWKKYLTGIILRQAELADISANATLDNGMPIPMVEVS